MTSSVKFTPNRTSQAIMKLVHGYLSKKKLHWTLMDQAWMLKHLDEWYGIKIARSTLNYNLAILREQGIINTITRHKRDRHTGAFVCQITLYKMTSKLKKFFREWAGYFKRCDWIPDIKALQKGHQPVVGRATTPDKRHSEYVRLKREERLRPREGT